MKLTKTVSAILALAIAGAQLFSCGKKADDKYSYSDGLDQNGFFEGLKAADIVTLPTYKGLDIEASMLEASDEDLQDQISRILSSAEGKHITDRAVADGDTVNIDYVGSVDGVEFQGGSTGGNGTDVTIGVTNYIDDFLQQLIGHKPGEKFDIEVTFPEDYNDEDTSLNGKDAIFNITINYIVETPTELTDEIAATYKFDTVDAMIDDIKRFLINNQKFTFFDGVIAQATCDNIPQSVLDYVINYDLESYSYYTSLYGVTIDEFITTQMGYESKQAYIDSNMEAYKENAVKYLAAQAIAELEGLSATDADIEEADYTEYLEEYGAPYLKQYLLFQEIIPNFIIENGIVK